MAAREKNMFTCRALLSKLFMPNYNRNGIIRYCQLGNGMNDSLGQKKNNRGGARAPERVLTPRVWFKNW